MKTNYEPFDERVNWISHSDYYFFESIQNITHQRVYIKRFVIRAINFLIWIPKLFSRRLKSPSQRLHSLHSLHLMPFLWIVPVEVGSYIWKFDKQKSWEGVFNLTRAQIRSWQLRKGWSRVISSWSTTKYLQNPLHLLCVEVLETLSSRVLFQILFQFLGLSSPSVWCLSCIYSNSSIPFQNFGWRWFGSTVPLKSMFVNNWRDICVLHAGYDEYSLLDLYSGFFWLLVPYS